MWYNITSMSVIILFAYNIEGAPLIENNRDCNIDDLLPGITMVASSKTENTKLQTYHVEYPQVSKQGKCCMVH